MLCALPQTTKGGCLVTKQHYSLAWNKLLQTYPPATVRPPARALSVYFLRIEEALLKHQSHVDLNFIRV